MILSTALSGVICSLLLGSLHVEEEVLMKQRQLNSFHAGLVSRALVSALEAK